MNKNELVAEMKRKNLKYEDVAVSIGISLNAFWRKINGLNDFTLPEIQIMVKELELNDEKVKKIFFN